MTMAGLQLLATCAALAACAWGQENVGFYTHFTSNPTIPVNTVAKFDVVETNLGDAYDVTTGVFTAPSDGYYVFNLFLQPKENKHSSLILLVKTEHSHLVILVENEQKCLAYGNPNGQGSCTIFVHLRRGDPVKVKAVGGDVEMSGHHSGFSGFMLPQPPQEVQLLANISQKNELFRNNLTQQNEFFKNILMQNFEISKIKTNILTQKLGVYKTKADNLTKELEMYKTDLKRELDLYKTNTESLRQELQAYKSDSEANKKKTDNLTEELELYKTDLKRELDLYKTNLRHENEQYRTNLTKENEQYRTNLTQENEQYRTNLMKENEQYRTNLTQENEQYRTNLMKENEQYRTNLTQELELHKKKTENLTQQLEMYKTRADEAWQLANETSALDREVQALLSNTVKEVNILQKKVRLLEEFTETD